MDTFVDYYELLHVQPSAPEPVIKASYRAMMQKLNHHPDRGGEVGFAQLLNDAERTLCNPKTRAQYDALRSQLESTSKARHGKSDEKPNSSASSWGEPGGSPAPRRKNTSEPGDNHTNRRTGNEASPDDGYPPLPSKPQCPFCLATYPSENTATTTPFSYSGHHRCRSCNGARTPIAHVQQTNDEELRKMHRQCHKTDARLWLRWPTETPFASVLSDFSPAGCALIHTKALDLNHTVMIETGLFNAICKVRHCKASGKQLHLIGLEFVTLDMLAAPGSLLNATA